MRLINVSYSVLSVNCVVIRQCVCVQVLMDIGAGVLARHSIAQERSMALAGCAPPASAEVVLILGAGVLVRHSIPQKRFMALPACAPPASAEVVLILGAGVLVRHSIPLERFMALPACAPPASAKVVHTFAAGVLVRHSIPQKRFMALPACAPPAIKVERCKWRGVFPVAPHPSRSPYPAPVGHWLRLLGGLFAHRPYSILQKTTLASKANSILPPLPIYSGRTSSMARGVPMPVPSRALPSRNCVLSGISECIASVCA